MALTQIETPSSTVERLDNVTEEHYERWRHWPVNWSAVADMREVGTEV
jgi:hypothetical protein